MAKNGKCVREGDTVSLRGILADTGDVLLALSSDHHTPLVLENIVKLWRARDGGRAGDVRLPILMTALFRRIIKGHRQIVFRLAELAAVDTYRYLNFDQLLSTLRKRRRDFPDGGTDGPFPNRRFLLLRFTSAAPANTHAPPGYCPG